MLNERIKQLKEQARDFYLAQEDLDCSITELHELVDAKFAELIVRECADIASQEDFDVMMKEGYPCSHTAEKIKKHFGVEE